MVTRERILAVADELRGWINRVSNTPLTVTVSIANYVETIAIDEFIVWDSENGYPFNYNEEWPDDGLTMDGCLAAFRSRLRAYMVYWTRLSTDTKWLGTGDDERQRIRKILAESLIPLVLLSGQIRTRPYSDMTRDFQLKLVESIGKLSGLFMGLGMGDGDCG